MFLTGVGFGNCEEQATPYSQVRNADKREEIVRGCLSDGKELVQIVGRGQHGRKRRALSIL